VVPLPYSYVSLMPHYDADTLYYHYCHYSQEVQLLNRLVARSRLTELSLPQLITQDLNLPVTLEKQIKNAAGSVYNHSLFFEGMYSTEARLPDNVLTGQLAGTYGSLEQFQQLFEEAADSIFGSGWVWLIAEGGGLHIATTRDNEVVNLSAVTPILVADLWEHAYFTMYQFDRKAYLDTWFRLVNWDRADQRLQAAGEPA
jgi:Fe-Mn family superoxide dismutase